MSTAKKPRKKILFDTLGYAKKLEEAGIPQKQAEAQVRLFSQVVEDSICSKQDLLESEERLEVKLKELECQIKETEGRVRVEVEAVRKEVKELEFKIEHVRKDLVIEIGNIRKDLTVEVEKIRAEVGAVQKNLEIKIMESKSELIKWFIGTFLVSMGVMTGMLTVVVRLIHP